jgi:hypothetical protein
LIQAKNKEAAMERLTSEVCSLYHALSLEVH